MADFFCKLADCMVGPFSGIELREAALACLVTETTLISTNPERGWLPAKAASNLFDDQGHVLPHPPSTPVPKWQLRASISPVTLAELLILIRDGSIESTDEAREEGNSSWVPCGDVSAFTKYRLGFRMTQVDEAKTRQGGGNNIGIDEILSILEDPSQQTPSTGSAQRFLEDRRRLPPVLPKRAAAEVHYDTNGRTPKSSRTADEPWPTTWRVLCLTIVAAMVLSFGVGLAVHSSLNSAGIESDDAMAEKGKTSSELSENSEQVPIVLPKIASPPLRAANNRRESNAPPRVAQRVAANYPDLGKPNVALPAQRSSNTQMYSRLSMMPADATSRRWPLTKWEVLPHFDDQSPEPGKKFVKLYFASGGMLLEMTFTDQNGMPLQRIVGTATPEQATMILQIDDATTIVRCKLSPGRLPW